MSFAYDGFDRLATTTYPLNGSEALSYDADSNVTLRCTRAGLPIAYGYDTLNRLATKTTAAPGTPCTTAPSGPVVTYRYDLAGRRTGVSDNSASITPVSVAWSVQYATTMTYDALNRPTGVSWTPAPTAVAPTAANITFAHSYNAVNQRTGQIVTDSGANVWIDYPSGPAATSYTANTLNQYTAVAAVSPTYDGNGNLLDDGTNSYGYDPENRLVSLSPSGSGTACVTACYTFDGRGRRKTRTVGATTTVSITDADNREVLEYDGGSGAILRWYAYGLGPNALLNQMDMGAGTRTTLLPDQLGSIIGSMTSGGGTVGSFAYRSYGKSASPPAQFGYTGQRFDTESGNYYYRARHYSPGWGRFLQADPIGHQGGMHLYEYVSSDPLNAVDPNGLDVLVVVGGPTSKNPFGHVAIAVTGAGVYSYGTGTRQASSLTDYLAAQAGYRTSTTYYIPTTHDQDVEVLTSLISNGNKPIGIISDNCASRTICALTDAGIYDWTTLSRLGLTVPLPSNAGAIAADNASSIGTIPQGTAADDSLINNSTMQSFNSQQTATDDVRAHEHFGGK